MASGLHFDAWLAHAVFKYIFRLVYKPCFRTAGIQAVAFSLLVLDSVLNPRGVFIDF